MPAYWPFGRRGGKAAKLKEGRVADRKRPVASTDVLDSDALRKTPSRRSSRRKRRSSRSTTSMPDVEKKSPDLAPFEKLHGPRHTSTDDITALPLSKQLEQSPHLRPVTNEHGIPYNFQHSSLSQSSLTARERGKLQRPQSLRKPPTNESTSLLRRKSSKKREHDPVREEEIRAMSMPLPKKRPAASSGGMLRRDSKKVKGGLNRHFERPTSNISLPTEDSIHSSMSGSSETRAFRVSALDMFSPRPKIRCSVGSQYYYSGARSSPDSHQEQKDTRRERRLTNTRDGKEEKRNSRIDDLADTLDAGALREILERDKRRREKKRKADDERLRRRLERRAEKQRAAEQGGTPATPRREARGAVGLGIEKETSTPVETVRPSTPMEDVRPSTPQPQRWEPTTPSKVEENTQLPTPVDSPTEDPIVANAQAVRYSRANMSPTSRAHTRGPSNVSELPALLSERPAHDTPVETMETVHDPNASGSLHPVLTADTTSTSQKGSGRRRSSEGRRMGMIASFFRRGRRTSQDQARTTPSEVSFSNTSRESMSRHPPPAHLVAPPTQPIQIRRPSSVPRRTMSKFREDLPDFPLSPPDSRVQSPEVVSTSAIATRRRSKPPSDLRLNADSPRPSGRTDSPVSPSVPAAGLMSQSLASVDSEGSWLSGKPVQRRSNKSQLRSSVGSSTVLKRNEDFNASYEELGIPDDEYFKRLTPQPDEQRRSAHSTDMLASKASSTAMTGMDTALEFDVEELPAGETTSEEELVKSSVGRQPTIVHRRPRVKSTEGLLSFFQAETPAAEEEKTLDVQPDEPGEQDSPTSESEAVVLQRAKSVDLGKHHSRQLSAGSAKLLDIPARRTSVDPKRSSRSSSRSALADSSL